MTLHDDPRLTRYALGEMNDADRAAFEATMTDADRAEADAIRAIGGTVRGALSVDRLVEGAAARAEVRQAGMPVLRRPVRWMLAAAASIAVAGLAASSYFNSTEPDREYAVLAGRGVLPGDRYQYQPDQLVKVGRSTLPELKFAETGGGVATASRKVSEPQDLVAEYASVTGAAAKTRQFSVEAQAQAVDQNGPPTLNSPVAADIRQLPLAAASPPPLVEHGTFSFPAKASLKEEQATLAKDAEAYRERLAASGESYAPIAENPFLDPHVTPLSTFGVDVDTASYSNVRRFLTSGQKPPADAVRIEELINYFPTSDAPPTDGKPFAIHADVARCPWNAGHDLVRVALKAKEVAVNHRPASNLVFLIDVSGSMNEPDKLPLVKRGLERLVDQLNENDRVAIVVYAGNAGLVLPSTNASDKATIRAAINHLEAGGSTNGGQGIELAYATAAQNFIRGGANRVILCTDGDFNVGVTDRGSLVSMIQDKAKAGVFLSVFGFGTDNLKDDTMEGLADKGNGTYAYVDTDSEAHKVFVEQASGTLLTVAKDVKIQVEFNPAMVKSYRLLGYEKRLLAKEDFNNDLKDAGDMGAGHNVVALYEIEQTGRARVGGPDVDKLKYQPDPATSAPVDGELLTLKVRYKAPDAPLEQGVSQLIEQPVTASDRAIDQASADFQFDAAVAGFGMLLRGSTSRGDCDWPTVMRLAQAGLGTDVGGHRAEFLTLVEKASKLGR